MKNTFLDITSLTFLTSDGSFLTLAGVILFVLLMPVWLFMAIIN